MHWPSLLKGATAKRGAIVLASVFLVMALAYVNWRLKLDPAQPVLKLKNSGAPVTTGDLSSWPHAVMNSENAALILKQAAQEIDLSPGPLPVFAELHRDLSSWQRSEFQRLIQQNQAALTLVHRALALQDSRWPFEWNKGLHDISPELSKLKQLSTLLGISSLLHLETGQIDLAFKDFTGTLHLASSLSKEPALIFPLIRMSCFAVSSRLLMFLLEEQKLSDEQLQIIQERLVDLESRNMESLKNALIGDRCLGIDFFLSSIQEQAQSMAAIQAQAPPRNINFSLWIREVLGVNDFDFAAYLDAFEVMINAAQQPIPQRLQRFDAFAKQYAAIPAWKQHLQSYSSQVVPALSKAALKDAADFARLRCSAAAVAIERFRIKHGGALPSRLDDLVPKILKETPEDPFTGKPLHFKRLSSGYIVYSLGENGQDDQGNAIRDIAFQITSSARKSGIQARDRGEFSSIQDE